MGVLQFCSHSVALLYATNINHVNVNTEALHSQRCQIMATLIIWSSLVRCIPVNLKHLRTCYTSIYWRTTLHLSRPVLSCGVRSSVLPSVAFVYCIQTSKQILNFYCAARMHTADYAVERCLSVCHMPVFCQNGYIYRQTFFTAGWPDHSSFSYQTVC